MLVMKSRLETLRITGLVTTESLASYFPVVVEDLQRQGITIKLNENFAFETIEIPKAEFKKIILSDEVFKRNFEIHFSGVNLEFYIELIAYNQYYTNSNLVNLILNWNKQSQDKEKAENLIIYLIDTLKFLFAFFYDSEYDSNQDLDRLLIDNKVRSGIYFLNKEAFDTQKAKSRYEEGKLSYFFENTNTFVVSDLEIIFGELMEDYFSKKEGKSILESKVHKESVKELLEEFNL
jgi:hypothetical protein